MKKKRLKESFYPQGYKVKITAFIMGFCICFASVEIMYLNLFFAVVSGIAGGFLLFPVFMKRNREKQQRVLLFQFRDWLDSLQGAVSSGSNLKDAVEKSAEDMLEMHGEKSLIVRESRQIRDGMNNSVQLSVLVGDFASGSGLEDVKSFSDTLSAAAEQGGNLSELIGVCRGILCERIATEAEIQTYLASNINELRIMSFMPFVAITALRFFGSDTLTGNSFGDIAIKSISMLIFVFSYFIGLKIIRVNT